MIKSIILSMSLLFSNCQHSNSNGEHGQNGEDCNGPGCHGHAGDGQQGADGGTRQD